jgi:hypothetical protein
LEDKKMAQIKYSFPHPVYGAGSDISGNPIKPSFRYTIADEQVILEASELSVDNADIEQLIADEKAHWQIRLQCPRTYYRESFLTKKPTWTRHIPGPDLEGKVEIETKIIATKPISDYHPTNSHTDYDGYDFDLSAGEVIGLGPTFSFVVDKLYDPLKAPVSSLLRIVEGSHDEGPYEVVFDDDLIFIKLSKQDWQEYPGVRDRVPTVIHSAIVLPVLSTAIKLMQEHSGTMWSDRLENLIATRGIDPMDSLKAAQDLLANPLFRTFGEINIYIDQMEIV